MRADPLFTVRKNYLASKKIYDDRTVLALKVPHFWAFVFEEAPEDIDCRIQPRDTAVLGALKSLQITRFEVESEDKGEPRSVNLTFTFDKNDWFRDQVLEKRFWHRRSKDGWTGLVSEPVKIHWKVGKDLTDGLLDMAVGVWEDEAHGVGKSKNQDALVERMERMPMDAVSFFAWFGYRGRKVSAHESQEAIREEAERKAKAGHGKTNGDDENEENEPQPDLRSTLEKTIATEDDPDDGELSYEIFPRGEELAIALSDDLYPGAIKYFSKLLMPSLASSADRFKAQGQEADALDSADEEVLDSDDGDSVEPAKKKTKISS